MPELHEVETIRRGLQPFLLGAKITKIDVHCEKYFQSSTLATTQLASCTVKSIRRFGKALVIDLENGHFLLIRLRMSGQLIFNPSSAIATHSTLSPTRFAVGRPSSNFAAHLHNSQTRVVIYFDRGTHFCLYCQELPHA